MHSHVEIYLEKFFLNSYEKYFWDEHVKEMLENLRNKVEFLR